MNHTCRWLLFGSVVCLTTFLPTHARAGGFTTARFGGEHTDAASDAVTSLYYDPAGIALGDGTRVYVEGLFAYRTISYKRDAGDIDDPGTGTPTDAIGVNSGSAHLANPIVSPFIGVTHTFGTFALGAGLYVPFGGQAKWDKKAANAMYPGAEDGPQRWAIVEGQQRSIYGTLAAAWRSPAKSVAFGVGVNIVSSSISLTRARNATGTDDLVNASSGETTEGRSLLEVSDVSPALGVGMIWQASPKVRLGVSYQSPVAFGQEEMKGTLKNKFGSAADTTENVVLVQRMPGIARVGAEIDTSPTFQLRLIADYEDWKVFRNQCLIDAADSNHTCTFNPDGSLDPNGGGSSQAIVNLPRNWKSTYEVAAGGAWHKGALEVGGSVTFDSNAVPDATMDPSLFDMNKVIPQAELDYGFGKFSLHAALADVVYFARTTQPRTVTPKPPSQNPDMAGTYKQNVTYLIVGIAANL